MTGAWFWFKWRGVAQIVRLTLYSPEASGPKAKHSQDVWRWVRNALDGHQWTTSASLSPITLHGELLELPLLPVESSWFLPRSQPEPDFTCWVGIAHKKNCCRQATCTQASRLEVIFCLYSRWEIELFLRLFCHWRLCGLFTFHWYYR